MEEMGVINSPEDKHLLLLLLLLLLYLVVYSFLAVGLIP